MDDLSFVQTVDRLGESIVVTVADAADRHDRLELLGLTPQLLDLASARCTRRVAGQAPLAGRQELLRPR
jgi:hypothetical protein